MLPLRIKSPYIILFFVIVTVLLLSGIGERTCRLMNEDAGYFIDDGDNWTVGTMFRIIGTNAYIFLGLLLSSMMYELSISLSLVLNMCELKDAQLKKRTCNICLLIIGLIMIVVAVYEFNLDALTHREHFIFEALGLGVLCLIYFSTIIELLRKLRVFVLEQSKREACLIRV